MKRLYIMRHGVAGPKPEGGSGKDKPLTELGRKQALTIGKALKEAPIDYILCSDALRTEETARLTMKHAGKALNIHATEMLYLASASELLDTIQLLDNSINAVLLVAHNPGVMEFTHYLAKKDAPDTFTEANLVVFTFEKDDWKTLSPRYVKLEQILCP